jgi:hypothetical protein
MNDQCGNVYENKGLWTGGWGLGGEGLPVASADQRHSLNFLVWFKKAPTLKGNSFLTERSANLYENKGSAFHDPGRSGNVFENTGT